MRLDQFSNPIFNEQEIFEAIYKGFRFNPNEQLFVENSEDIKQLEEQLGYSISISPIDNLDILPTEYDQALQKDWFMPDEYKNMDIEAWVWSQTPPWDPNHTRVAEELEAYKARNMLDLLRWLKYFVDTCSKENIVWGVGRGSSVASYVLFLIGVHSVDSIKYNLDWQEFLR